MELLRELALGDGRALVIVTHDARIFEFADRIARMDDGRIIEIEEKSSPRINADERGSEKQIRPSV
jgi:putative ABC transport system ATP-binding protein